MIDKAASAPGARSRLRLLRPLGWLVGVLALVLLVLQLRASLGAIGTPTLTAGPALAALALAAVVLLGYGWLWWRNLRQLGEQIGLTTALRIWFLSQLARYIPGNIWHLFGRALLAHEAGVSRQAVATSMVLELFQTITAALLLALALLPFWPMPGWGRPWLLLVLPALAIYAWPRLLALPLRWIGRQAEAEALGNAVRRRDLLLLLPGYLLSWTLYGCGLFLLGLAVQPLAPAQLPAVIASFAVAWVIGFLSFITPSGIGVREGVLALLLASVMPQPAALLLALLARVWLTLAELCTLVLAVLIDRPYRRGVQGRGGPPSL